MSSLGDLLLLHSKQQANKTEKVSDSDNDCDNNRQQSEQQTDLKPSQTNQEKSLSSPKLQTIFPTQPLNASSNNNNPVELKLNQQKSKLSSSPSQQHNVTSHVPKYIEKNDVEETQSNASSTDDYVRELLDPNDRPKNVWHVVEPPKVEQTDDNSKTDFTKSADNSRDREYANSPPTMDRGQGSLDRARYDVRGQVEGSNNDDDYDTNSAMATTPPPPPLHSPPLGSPTNIEQSQVDRGEDGRSNDKHMVDVEQRKSSTRGDGRHRSSGHRNDDRERSSSSRRNRHRDDRGRNGDRDRDRHDRRRSSRRDSDDEDGYNRHRSSRRRRSRSKSPRTSPSRRSGRSRSNSISPVGKRNSRTILVMQLSPRVITRDLEDFFNDIGRVREVRLIMDSKTRRHKGIAYIEFESSHSATKALALNGKKLFGAPLVIQPVQKDGIRQAPDERHTSSSQHTTSNYNATSTSHSSSRSYLPPNCYRIYVGGLNVNLTEDMIRSVFEPFGPIIRLELMRDRVTNLSRGYAFITYADIEDGQNAVQNLDGFELAGKSLRVSKSADKSERFAATGQNSTAIGGTGQDHGTSGGGTDHFNDINDPYSNYQKYR